MAKKVSSLNASQKDILNFSANKDIKQITFSHFLLFSFCRKMIFYSRCVDKFFPDRDFLFLSLAMFTSKLQKGHLFYQN